MTAAPFARAGSSLLLLGLIVSSAAGQPDGVDVSPKGGRFKVRFPGRPKEATQKTKTPIGELAVYTATFATAEGNVFLVSHTDYPADAAKADHHPTLIAGARDGLAGKDGKVVSEAPIVHGPDKVGGREFVIDKGKTQLRFRVFVKDNRLFQAGTVGTGAFVTGKDATDFLDSFELAK
jgi:hypothetical protein